MYAFGLSGAVAGAGRDVILAESTLAVNELTDTIGIVQTDPVVSAIQIGSTIAAIQAAQTLSAIQASPSFVAAIDLGDTIGVDICSPIFDGTVPSDVSTIRVNVTLGENVSQYRVIAVLNGLGYLADKDTAAHTSMVVGISVSSGITTQTIEIQTFDEFTEGTWSWDTTKPIYLGNSGVLTQTVPTTGFLQRVAKPITATRIMIDIDDPIVLA